jgi:halocarboxylic acid dehydrogenase DehI
MARRVAKTVPGADPDRGAIVLDRFPEVTDAQAGVRTRAVYTDIQRSLRVPFVNGIFRALANDLEFLEAAWAEVAPFVRTERFERDADRLRRLAQLRPLPAAEDVAVDLDQVRGAERIRAYTDTVHYALPKVLLAAELLDLTLVRSPKQRRRRAIPDAELPLGPAAGATDVRHAAPKKLRGARRVLLEDIRATHDHPFVAGFYRGVAQWPLVLEAFWSVVKPTVGTGRYVDRRRDLVENAYRMAGHHAVEGIDRDQVALDEDGAQELRDLIGVYRLRIVPDLLIDATLIKSILDGGVAALESRFSAVPAATEAPIRNRRATSRSRARPRPAPLRQRRGGTSKRKHVARRRPQA